MCLPVVLLYLENFNSFMGRLKDILNSGTCHKNTNFNSFMGRLKVPWVRDTIYFTQISIPLWDD